MGGSIMLATMLLAGLVPAPLSVAGLAMPVKRRTRGPGGRWSAAGRLVLAMAAISIVALVVAISLRLRGISGPDRDAGIASVVMPNLAWLPATRRWLARARVCWASSIFLITVYLAVALRQTLVSRSGTAGTAGGLLLWTFELLAAVMSCAYLWEICDALGTEQWRRRITAQTPLPAADRDLPMVSLHVPAHNEPPEMVMDTLRSLISLDYPRYELVVIDDNTDDESLWRPVEAWCA